MKFYPYIIKEKIPEADNSTIFKMETYYKSFEYKFISGQFAYIVNPSLRFSDPRPFSIASAEKNKQELEFCIKRYGNWTGSFLKKKPGEMVFISDPRGNFVWDEKFKNAVFLVGGIGISPVISILRTLAFKKSSSSITILYGARTPETVIYENVLKNLNQRLNMSLHKIFSHIDKAHHWKGYRGFISEKIIKKETELSKKPTFFIIGPPIFIEKIKQALFVLKVEKEKIKTELISSFNIGSISLSK